MTREIKFRAWDGNKMMSSPAMYEEYGVLNYAIQACERRGQILMQFTGLKDKNGKEIYEGDIVKEREFVSQVVWNEEGAYFHLKRGDVYSGYTLKSEVSRSEIIGNIWENPNLLK